MNDPRNQNPADNGVGSTGGSAPCPDCYGGHFRPCNVCGDTGWVEYVQPSPEQVRKDLVAAGVDPEEAWRAFQRDVLKVTPNVASEPRLKAVGSDGLFDGPAKDSRK